MGVQLFEPCLARLLSPGLAAHCLKLLKSAEAHLVPTAVCCGQPAYNAGYIAEALRVAVAAAHALDQHPDPVVVPAGSCAAMIAHRWPELAALATARDATRLRRVAARTWPLSTWLDAHATPIAPRNTTPLAPGRVAWHASCHLRRTLQGAAAGARVLNAAGYALADWQDADRCCGFGGVFATRFPEVSAALGRDRLQAASDAGAALVASSDPGCALHMAAVARCSGMSVQVVHFAALLGPGSTASNGVHPASGCAPRCAPCARVRVREETGFAARAAAARADGRAANTARTARAALRARQRRIGQIEAWPHWVQAAAEARRRAVDGIGALAQRLHTALEARGAHVVWAADAAEAACAVASVVRRSGAERVVAAKSMTAAEIGLRPAVEASGARVWETDLGELIVQLAGEAPSHVTAPALHRGAPEIAAILRERLGIDTTPDDESSLVTEVRKALRAVFLRAGVAVMGCNVASAASGTLAVVENEGNIRLGWACAPVVVVVMGIDKVVESDADMDAVLRVLPPSATGQRVTSYVHFLRGPAPQRGGPREMVVVLLDNGRSRLAHDPELRDVLRCVRCGACMVACPVYQSASGHAWPPPYPGPLGSVLAPALWPSPETAELATASTLCGACAEVCPVGIPLDDLLVRLRRRHAAGGLARMGWRLWSAAASSPGSWRRFVEPAARTLDARSPLGRCIQALGGWAAHGRAPLGAELGADLVAGARQSHDAGTPAATGASAVHPLRSAPPQPPPPAPESKPSPLERLRTAAEASGAALATGGEAELARWVIADAAAHGVRTLYVALPRDSRAARLAAALVAARSPLKVRWGELPQRPPPGARPPQGVGVVALAHSVHVDTAAALWVDTPSQPAWLDALADVEYLWCERLDDENSRGVPLRPEDSTWRSAVWRCGPSRTADIEKRLVLGMHGPRRVALLVAPTAALD